MEQIFGLFHNGNQLWSQNEPKQLKIFRNYKVEEIQAWGDEEE